MYKRQDREFVFDTDYVKITVKEDGEVMEHHKDDDITVMVSPDGETVTATNSEGETVDDFEPMTYVENVSGVKAAHFEGRTVQTNDDNSKTYSFADSEINFKPDNSFEVKSLSHDQTESFDPSTNEYTQTRDGNTIKFNNDGSTTKTDEEGRETNVIKNSDGEGYTITYPDNTESKIGDDGSLEKTLCNGYQYVKLSDGSFKIYDDKGKLVKSEVAPEGQMPTGQDMLNSVDVNTNSDGDIVVHLRNGDMLTLMLDENKRIWDRGDEKKYTYNDDNTVLIVTSNEDNSGFDDTIIGQDGSVTQTRGSDTVSIAADGTVTGTAFEPDFEVVEGPEGNVITRSFFGLEFENHGVDGKVEHGPDYSIEFRPYGSVLHLITGETITVLSSGEVTVTTEESTAQLVVSANGDKTFTDEHGEQTTLITNSDGDRVTTYPDGTSSVESAGGVKETTYEDGSTSQSLPYGCFVEFNSNQDVIYFMVGHNPFRFDEYEFSLNEDQKTVVHLGESGLVYKEADVVEFFGYKTFDIEYNATDKSLTVSTPQGTIVVDEFGGAVDTQGNGNVITISPAGVVSGLDSGQNVMDPNTIFTPVTFLSAENGSVTLMLPGELVVTSHADGTKEFDSREGMRSINTDLEYNGSHKSSPRLESIDATKKLTVHQEGEVTEYEETNKRITILGPNGNNIVSEIVSDERVTTDLEGNVISTDSAGGLKFVFQNGMEFLRNPNGVESIVIGGVPITQENVETNQEGTTFDNSSNNTGGSGTGGNTTDTTNTGGSTTGGNTTGGSTTDTTNTGGSTTGGNTTGGSTTDTTNTGGSTTGGNTTGGSTTGSQP